MLYRILAIIALLPMALAVPPFWQFMPRDMRPKVTINHKPYRLVEKLGEGVRGVGFLAEPVHPESDLEPERFVVVKRFHKYVPQTTIDNEVQHLKRNREWLGDERLSDGYYYDVQKYVPGTNMHKALETIARYNPDQIPEIRRKYAEAVDRFHRDKKTIHRDMHVGNAILSPDTKSVNFIDYDQSIETKHVPRRDRRYLKEMDKGVALATFDSRVNAIKQERSQ